MEENERLSEDELIDLIELIVSGGGVPLVLDGTISNLHHLDKAIITTVITGGSINGNDVYGDE